MNSQFTTATLAPLLTTKLYIPKARAADLVTRPRLLELLNQGLDRKLTLIAAPAGFGKTTLLAQWLAETSSGSAEIQNRIAWLSLEASDNDPVRFFTYLICYTMANTAEGG